MTRLPAGVLARLVVTDLFGNVTTWLPRGLLNAGFTAQLNQPMTITADVRSSDAGVNTLYTDGFPLVAQSNRLIYVFLNERPGELPTSYVIRGAGILMSPQDQADADIGTTHIAAFDAWQWLMGIPAFFDSSGTEIPQEGRPFWGVAGNVIAMTVLGDALQSLIALGYQGPGFGVLPVGFGLIDLPASYGGAAASGFWSGTEETTPTLDFLVQAGQTVGDVFTGLSSAGNDEEGTAAALDIWMEPIYDPANRPGYINQISVFNLMGEDKPAAVFGWGRMNRTATTADREHDGTPGSFVNIAQFVAGQGGELDPILSPIQSLPASVNTYYPYWAQQFFPGQPFASVVENLAIQALTLQGQGKRTFLIDVDPLRGALPFRDYGIGDRVPIYSTEGQRVASSGLQRVEGIPVLINSDGVTTVSQLLTSPDWPQEAGT